ncbi:MAG: hypothetical protein V1823_00545 [Chloroflexota bacterium]
MALFEKYHPQDRIYLTSIDGPEEPPAAGRSRLLLCDARGSLTVGDISTATYEAILGRTKQLSEDGKSCASLCLDRGRGEKASYVLEIDQAQAVALDKLLHAIYETQKVPEELVPHLAEIIMLGRQKISRFRRLTGKAEGIHPIRSGG